MDFSVLLWLFLFIAVAVIAVKLALKISKIVVSIISAVIVIILIFAFLAYANIIDLNELGIKEYSKSALSKGKDKVTGYVVEQGKELLNFQKEKNADEGGS